MSNDNESIKRAILATYTQKDVHSHYLSPAPLPSREILTSILDALMALLYPGYFGEYSVKQEIASRRVSLLIDNLHEKLHEQIFLSFRHFCKFQDSACAHCQDLARNEVERFLMKIPVLREWLRDDVEAAYDGDPAAKSRDEIIFSYPGIYAVTVYRLAHALHEQQVPLIPRILTEVAHSRTGIDIHPGARIGRSFFIDHGTGVVIGETTEIGDRVRMYQGVTLGAVSFPRDDKGQLIRGQKRHPTVEDDCIIYAGATVLGGDTVVGRGSIIGSNVRLMQSVPPGSKVMAEPMKHTIVRRQPSSGKKPK
jgi:serine O-acetyltransferase